MLRRRMDTGRIVRSGDPQGWNLRASEIAPESSAKPLVKRRKTEQAHICLGTNGLRGATPTGSLFLIVNGALEPGCPRACSRRSVRSAASSIPCTATGQYTEAGLFSCCAGTTPARAQEVIGLLRRELDDVAEGGLTAEEFDRAKGHVKGRWCSRSRIWSRMSRIGKSRSPTARSSR